MQFPLNQYRLGLTFNAPYGSFLARLLGSRHMGVDLLPNGSYDVRPMEKGVVTLVSRNAGSCGGLVDIDYGNGLKSRYCHLEDIRVKAGDKVWLDTVVARMGNTGTSTTTHLHWVTWQDGVLIDPLLAVKVKPQDLLSQVNSEIRKVWGREPLPKESLYFQKRIAAKSITSIEKLRSVMKYWHSRPRVLFLLELQKWGAF